MSDSGSGSVGAVVGWQSVAEVAAGLSEQQREEEYCHLRDDVSECVSECVSEGVNGWGWGQCGEWRALEGCGGQRIVQCACSSSAVRGDVTYRVPLWKKTQEKTCFLPDMFRLARQSECRLLVLLDGERQWAPEGCNDSRPYITLSDTTIDSSIESECSDRDGYCGLTWLRVYGPGERIALDASTLGECENGDGQHDGKVFDAMSHEETAYGGYRCGVLRVDATAWAQGEAPSVKAWSAFEALFNRGLSETKAAYNCSNVLLVDVCDKYLGTGDEYWGIGDRAAAMMILHAGLQCIDPSSNISDGQPTKSTKLDSQSDSNSSAVVETTIKPTGGILPQPTSIHSIAEINEHDTICGERNIGEQRVPALPGKATPGLEVVPVSAAFSEQPLPVPPHQKLQEKSLQELMEMAEKLLDSGDNQKETQGVHESLPDQVPEAVNDSNIIDMVELKTSDDKDDMRKAAELLIKCSENSDELKQEYLAKQKQLSNRKLADRLEKRRQEKARKAMESGSESVFPPSPPLPGTIHQVTQVKDCQMRLEESEGRKEQGIATVALLARELLQHSRLLTLTQAQHEFVHSTMKRRASKVLATKGLKS